MKNPYAELPVDAAAVAIIAQFQLDQFGELDERVAQDLLEELDRFGLKVVRR